jgi:hypothetical protein
METAAVYELELHHAQHIEARMSALHQSVIPMSVPSIGETMLINAANFTESRPVNIEVEDSGNRITIYRRDMNIYDRANMPMQIAEADPRNCKFGHELFKVAVNSLTYTRTGNFTWNVDIDEQDINDIHMFREFTGIFTNFAWMRQEGLF